MGINGISIFLKQRKSVPNVLTRVVFSQKMAVNFTALIQVRVGVTIVGGRVRSLIEGDIGIFGLRFWLFFRSVFRFLCQKTSVLRFWCSLRFADFSFFRIRFSVLFIYLFIYLFIRKNKVESVPKRRFKG